MIYSDKLYDYHVIICDDKPENPHTWEEINQKVGEHGFLCTECLCFVKYNATRSLTGCNAE